MEQVKLVILGEGKCQNYYTMLPVLTDKDQSTYYGLTNSIECIARVGKTSLLKRYVKNEFSSDQVSTIDATFLEKKIQVGQQPMKLAIWDTAGQERYHALNSVYYRGSAGAVIVYDVTDQDSWTKV